MSKIQERLKVFRREYQEINDRVGGYYQRSAYKRRCASYVKYYRSEKVAPNVILYESFWGRGMVDNPYAIFRFLLDDPAFAEYTHVWVIEDMKDNEPVISRFRDRANVVFVKFQSEEYLRYLAKAKYLINNTTFQDYFVKKPEQVYINTWHGTPLKSMGYEQAGGSVSMGNIIRNFLHADYLLSANELMDRMYLRSNKLRDILPGAIITEGYPRIDRMFCDDRASRLRDLQECGVRVDPDKTLILYAPTWKQTSAGKVIVNGDELLAVKNELEKRLDPEKYQILIKPHQYVYKALRSLPEYRGLLVPSTIDANEILSVTDILISDYSSIFFDFMALDRPILFYITDLEQYQENRGLSVSPEELPGPYTADLAELAGFVENIDVISREYAEKYAAMREAICPHEDGGVCRRICDIVWNGAEKDYNIHREKTTKKKMLITNGQVKQNGITHSLVSLLRQIDYDEWDVSVYLSVDKKDPEMVRLVNEDIDPRARVIARVGYILNDCREEVRREFIDRRGLYKPWWRKLYPWDVIRREYRRCLGYAHFDRAIDFGGFGRINAAMIAVSDSDRKAIWQHSDILSEMNREVNGEMPNLLSLHYVISLYPMFDRIVACGRTVMEVNRNKLGTSDTRDRFTYAKNTMNIDRIRSSVNAGLTEYQGELCYVSKCSGTPDEPDAMTLLRLPAEGCTNFVAMGRLSTEKNYFGLIEAFARYNREYPETRLYIIGDGPLRTNIEESIRNNGMEGRVLLTGNLRNPFAFMTRCDCFILSSFYEGQPLVVLEARACGLPVIMTDFETAKDTLIPNGQLIVQADVDSLYQGLCAFSQGGVPSADFDPDAYNSKAYEEFIQAIM